MFHQEILPSLSFHSSDKYLLNARQCSKHLGRSSVQRRSGFCSAPKPSSAASWVPMTSICLPAQPHLLPSSNPTTTAARGTAQIQSHYPTAANPSIGSSTLPSESKWLIIAQNVPDLPTSPAFFFILPEISSPLSQLPPTSLKKGSCSFVLLGLYGCHSLWLKSVNITPHRTSKQPLILNV